MGAVRTLVLLALIGCNAADTVPPGEIPVDAVTPDTTCRPSIQIVADFEAPCVDDSTGVSSGTSFYATCQTPSCEVGICAFYSAMQTHRYVCRHFCHGQEDDPNPCEAGYVAVPFSPTGTCVCMPADWTTT